MSGAKVQNIRRNSYFCGMKLLYNTLGTVTLLLALIGIFVPLLPTTPFLLLTAALYFRGSTRLYNRLMSHPVLGPYIRRFREERAIPLTAKVISIGLTWLTLLYATFFLSPWLWMQILLPALALGVTLHILSYKTSK